MAVKALAAPTTAHGRQRPLPDGRGLAPQQNNKRTRIAGKGEAG